MPKLHAIAVATLVVLAHGPGDLRAQAPAASAHSVEETAASLAELDALAGDFGARARVPTPIVAAHPEDPTASGTAVDLQERDRAGETLSDVVSEVPGATVLSLGGTGQFAGLRLRGGSFRHTRVLLGNLPLDSGEGGAFDLSLVPIWALERLEVYRGGAPVWFGDGSIGGVLRLVPRRAHGTRLEARAMGGSFGTYRAAGAAQVARSRADLTSVFDLSGTRGDYPIDSDFSTPLAEGDDDLGEQTRRNGQSLTGSVLLHGNLHLDAGTIESLVWAVNRQSGVLGTTGVPGLNTSQRLTQLWSAVGFSTERARDEGRLGHRVEARVAVGTRRRQVSDPFGEVGLSPEQSDDRIFETDLRLAAAADLTEHFELSAVGSGRFFHRAPHDALRPRQEPSSRRGRFDAAVEARIHGDSPVGRYEIRPSARLTVAKGRFRFEEFNQDVVEEARDAHPTFRLGLALAPRSDLALRASVYTGVRLPTLFELFGNRGSVVRNPELESERASGGDLGVALRGEYGPAELLVDLGAFVGRHDDLIRFVRTGQHTVRADNVDQVLVAGAEALGRLAVWGHLRFDASLTYLHSADRFGNQLPLQPPFMTFARAEAGTGALGRWLTDLAVYVAIDHRARRYLDPANLVAMPSQNLLATGLRYSALDGSLCASIEVADLLDERPADFLGFPLPGRRISAQLTYRKEL